MLAKLSMLELAMSMMLELAMPMMLELAMGHVSTMCILAVGAMGAMGAMGEMVSTICSGSGGGTPSKHYPHTTMSMRPWLRKKKGKHRELSC